MLAIFAVFFRVASSQMRALNQVYPQVQDQATRLCGYYVAHTYRFSWPFRVSVNSHGIELTQIVVPYIWRVGAFIPWQDAILRMSGGYAAIGATQLPEVEFAFNRVLMDRFRHFLNTAPPFGHTV